MAEARFSCQSHSALSLNNLSRLHDLIQKKANDSSAVEAAASAHRADDLKTLSLRPAEGWKKVQSRLQSFFVEKITTPAVMKWK